MAGFCAFVFSHNLGFALLTGGSARLKLYSPAGLSVGQIVRVSTFTAWNFCLSAALVMGVTKDGEAERNGLLMGGPSMLVQGLGAGLRIMHAGKPVVGMGTRPVDGGGR